LSTRKYISIKSLTLLAIFIALLSNSVQAQMCSSPALVSMSVTTQNLRCSGDNSGSISVSITGGATPSYTYSLYSVVLDPIIVNNHPINNYTFSNLPADNNYFLVIQVPIGGGAFAFCSQSISLTQPDPLSISSGSITHVTCHGANDGAINAVVSGGPTMPYTYLWSNGATTEDISGLTAGDYTLTITDGNGCSLSNTFTVTEPNAITATSNITNVSCLGASDGAIDITISGGSAPYKSTVWSNGATTEDVSGLTAGSYSVLITDNNNCTKTLNFTITQPLTTVTITNTITNINCNGTSTGAIAITPSGGTAPYTYLWNTGATTQNLTGVPAGNYSVTITDANGCPTAFGTFAITQNPTIALTITPPVTNVNCNGNSTGAITINPTGGTAPYTYLWSNGTTTKDLTNAPAGSYTVTITDNTACSRTFGPYTITQPAAVNATAATTNASCNGTSTGSIVLSPAGGTPGYTYLWSNGATTKDLTNVPAGSYTVTITDSRSCNRAAGPFTINQPVPITATGTLTNVACHGGSTGAISISTPTGGTPSYSYSWSNGATSRDLTGLAAGTYILTITDANGCKGTLAPFVITEPTAVTATNTITNISCNGTSTGAIAITPSGGTAPYTYLWNTGATTQNLTGVPAGNYSVTITDANGCPTAFGTFAITQNPTIALTITPPVTNVNCNGNSTGAITINPTGGTAPYTYLWSNGTTTKDLTNAPAGSYTVTITDNTACSRTFGPYTITQPAAVNATAATTNASCNGTSTGSIVLSPAGGTPGYTYLWSNGATTKDLTNVPAGSYTVTITDSRSCNRAAGPFTINQPVPITATGTLTNVACHGGSKGAISISNPTGGTPSYSYSWSNGATSRDLTGLAAGTYILTITDANGCKGTLAPFVITEPTAVTATNTITNINCNGTSTGAIAITPSGGTAPYTYLWNTGATTQNLTGVPAGNYSVTITDANGCPTAFGTFAITQNPTIALTITPPVTNVNCNGNSTGAITINPTGGTAPYTYLWSNGTTTKDLTNAPAGSYTVTITDNTACSRTFGPYTITQPAAVNATAATTNASCNGTSTGSIVLSPAGGTPGYTYLWSNGATTKDLTNVPAGSYTVTITDSRSCNRAAGPFTINQPVPITATGTLTNVACHGGSTGAISISTPTGGTPSYSYSWSNGATSRDLTGLAAGTYTLTITDANGCKGTLPTFTITQPAAIASVGAVTNVVCNGTPSGAVNISTPTGGVAPYTYLWNNSATTQNLINIPEGNYSVVITDANNCTLSLPFVITEPGTITSTVTPSNATCNATATGAINVSSPTGGTAPYTYSWSNGETTQNITHVAAGSYTLTITDSKGCTKLFGPYTITEPASISSTGTTVDPSCNGSASGSISLTPPAGGTAPYNYVWSNGATSQNLTNIIAGTYSVTITDSKGCANGAPLSFTLINGAPITGTASATPALICSGEGTTISALIAPAYTPATNAYSFNGGTTFQNASSFVIAHIIADTTITVLVKDINGCLSDPILVTISTDNINGTLTQTKTISCFGANDGEITMNVPGGPAGYTYSLNGSPLQSSHVFSNLSKGTYVITVDNGTTCQSSYTITLDEPVLLTIGIKQITDNDPCAATNTGSIALTTNGGTKNYSYTISPSGISQTDSTFSNLPANAYTISVIDSKGCTASTNATINQPAPITITSSETPVNCTNPLSGEIDVTVTNGTAPFTYVWSNGSTNQDLINLTAGTYKIIVTDSKNCKDSLTVIIDNAPSVTGAAIATPATVCSGQSSIVSATFDAAFTPGATGYSFDGGLTFQASSNFTIASIVADTLVHVVLKDINSCVSNVLNVAIATSKINASISVSKSISCNGGNDGEITIAASGNTSGYTYSINGGAFQTSPVFPNLSAGTYTIVIDDGSACNSSYTESLTDPAAVTIGIKSIVNVAPCAGGNNGSISVTVNGGSQTYSYTITPAGSTQTDSTFSNLVAGNYSITVIDTKGCTASITGTVIQPTGVDTSLITETIVHNICAGNNNGSIKINNVTGGISPYTYTHNGVTNTTGSFEKLLSGKHTITITDDGGCPTPYLFTIKEPLPILFATNIIPSSCVSPDGSIEIFNVTGGTPAYKYSINDGTTYGNTTLFTDLAPGSYPVRVGDQNGCSYAYSVTLPTKTAPVPYIRINEPLCNGGDNGFVVVDSVSGGLPLFQYKFNGINVGSSTVYSNLASGQYPLVITDLACTYDIDSFYVYNKTTHLYDTLSADKITVGEPTAITASVFSSNEDRYESSGVAGVYSITGGKPGYLWSVNNTLFERVTSDTILLNGLSRGNHTIYVVDTNGCRGTFDITIYVEFFIPNLITPNKDGKNDRFEIMALPAGSELLIVNRWGNRVYLSSNYDNSWDADDDSDGVYYYELTLPNGNKHKGWLEVTR
jgi:gliding motility-associated-like protein